MGVLALSNQASTIMSRVASVPAPGLEAANAMPRWSPRSNPSSLSRAYSGPTWARLASTNALVRASTVWELGGSEKE